MKPFARFWGPRRPVMSGSYPQDFWLGKDIVVMGLRVHQGLTLRVVSKKMQSSVPNCKQHFL